MKALKTVSAVFLSALIFLSGCSHPSFFEKQGLVITPQGHIELLTVQTDGENDISQINVGVDVSVTESSSTELDGYNDITCRYVFDLSERAEGARLATWQSAFDRYTGRSFEFDSSSLTEGEDMTGSVQFDYRENHYDVQMTYGFETDEENNTMTVYITVTCPEDYDGTVFQLGYSDMQINQANSEIDYSQPYMIDQLPGYGTNGHDYYYFSASDN